VRASYHARGCRNADGINRGITAVAGLVCWGKGVLYNRQWMAKAEKTQQTRSGFIYGWFTTSGHEA